MPRIVTFLYHEVTDDPGDSGFQRASALPYKHSRHEFSDHLDILAHSRLRPVTVRDLQAHSGDGVMITFDDGGQSNLYIADELDRRGFVGHFFVPTSMIGQPKFLDAGGIRELARRGHIVGSHSHTHPNVFMDQTLDQMAQEWKTSKTILEDLTGGTIDCCSVPGGDANANTYLSAAQCGYRVVFDSEPYYSLRRQSGVSIVGRVCPKVGTPRRSIQAFSRFQGFRRARALRTVKQTLKRVIYPTLSAFKRRRYDGTY